MATKKKSTTRKILFWVIGLLVVVLVLAVVGSTVFGGGEDVRDVEVERAATRSITQVVTASGKVQPEIEVKISPDVSGEIIELPVQEGDQVQRGALLARIRPDFYAAQREQAEAGVLQAQAALAQRKADMLKAELDYERQKELYDKGVISETEYLTAQTQHEVAKAAHEAAQYSVQSAQARLREAGEQLGKTSIYSPMTGTISQLNVEMGERVVGTSQMAGTEMMRVAQLEQMELEVDVNENDVVNVSVGDTASIEIDAYPERFFRGVVTEIANSARVTGAGSQEQVTNFPVKVRILDAHNVEGSGAAGGGAQLEEEEVPGVELQASLLRPGMSGTVDVYTKTVPDAVVVPIQAVTVRDFNQVKPGDGEEADGADSADAESAIGAPLVEDLRKVVFLVEEGEAKMVEVETGIADDTHVEVRSGLSGGETVITGPYSLVSRTLQPGMAVNVEEGPARDGRPITASR